MQQLDLQPWRRKVALGPDQEAGQTGSTAAAARRMESTSRRRLVPSTHGRCILIRTSVLSQERLLRAELCGEADIVAFPFSILCDRTMQECVECSIQSVQSGWVHGCKIFLSLSLQPLVWEEHRANRSDKGCRTVANFRAHYFVMLTTLCQCVLLVLW